MGVVKIISVGIFGFILAGCGPKSYEIEALTYCQILIKKSVKYKIVKNPGFVSNSGTKANFNYVWPNGKIILQNGFGAEVLSSARCSGVLNGADMTVSKLQINGQDIITSPLNAKL